MIPKPLHALNEGLAFLVELFAFGALCWWGFHVTHDFAGNLLLGLGSPVAAMVVWGMFAAPKARFVISLVGVLLVKAAVFASCAAALYGLGDHAFAEGFAIAAAANTALATFDRDALFRQVGHSDSRS
ncbi:YrdB family protein [Actinacidiphila soli]|uniref:YrdB family protein n=1 Tax=Actinacidiphila soli TaxID=2487275 RepID=UPI001F0BBA5A|nr:YrdB family protein [Actinacidiphila soli]